MNTDINTPAITSPMHTPIKTDRTFKAFKPLLISALLAASSVFFSAPSIAFDLKGALKEAAEKELGQQSDPAAETTAPQQNSTETTQNTGAEAKTQGGPAFNWKNPSTAEEIALGREIAGSVLGAAPLVKDAALQKYVNAVGRWVASQSERPDLPWRFGVIESEDINAFAAPGGYIMLTKGLYRKLANEAQLAGVLGHEIGHVVKKHQLKVLQKQQLLSVGAGFLSSKYAKDNKLASTVIGTGAEISARSLDKTAEYEADRLGLSYATRAGYEPYGLTEVLQTLSQADKNDSSVTLLFKTHPHPDERLVALGDAIGSKLDNIKNAKTLENRLYKLKN